MKNISRWIVISVLFYGLILAGCDKRSDVERDEVSFEALNSEEILGESSDYQNLRALMGNLTYKELLNLLDGSLKKLNALQAQGYTTSADYQTLYNILNNMYTMMLEDQAAHANDPAEGVAMSEASQALSDLVTMAAENHVGSLLNQVIRQTGPQVLTENIYPMLAYALSADDALLKGAFGGVSLGSFENEEDFRLVMRKLNGLLDSDGKYADLHDRLGDIIDAAKKNKVNNLTFGDMRDLVASLVDSLGETSEAEEDDVSSSTVGKEEVVDNVTAALDDLWNDPAFREDLLIVLAEAGDLMAVENGGDTDFGRILLVARQLLAPARRDNLRQFVTSALHGLAPSSDGETLEGLIERIAGTDTNQDGVLDTRQVYQEGIGAGLLMSVTRNMYNQDRRTAEVKTSGLRALMYMMQEANVVPHAQLFGANLLDLGPVLGMMDSPDGGTVANVTTNMAEWTVGEVVTAMKDHPDWTVYRAFDWVLYEKRYQMVLGSLPLMTFNGMVHMMTNDTIIALMTNQNALLKMKPNLVGIIDPFPAFVELAGGWAPSGEGTKADAFMNRAGTAGQRHKLFGLFAPLMQYYWDPNGDGNPADQRVGDMVKMLVLMNEIDCDAAQNPYIDYSLPYVALSSNDASFKTDASGIFMKLIDGGDQRDGGMLYYALRSHDGDSTKDGILLDKALDLIVRIVFALDSEKYVLSNGETTFNYLLRKLDIQRMDEEDINDIVTALFDGTDGDAPLIETVYKLLNNNHDPLVAIAKPVGTLLLTLAANNTGTNTSNLEALVADGQDVWPILKEMVAVEDDTEESTLGDLIDYLTKKKTDGSDNPFMRNAKILAYRILDVKHATYNAGGKLSEDVPLTGPDGLLVHLLGSDSLIAKTLDFVGLADNGLYDFGPLKDFLLAATGSPDILWTALNDGGDMLDRVMGDESLSLSFVRSLVTPVDKNGDGVKEAAVLYDILRLVDLEPALADDEFMDRVLNDVALLLTPKNPDEDPLAPGGETFKMLLKVLEFVLNNTTVK